MKRFSKILLVLMVLLGFATSVDAASASSTIYAYSNSTRYEYVDGLEVYYTTASGYPVYALDYGTYFNSSTYLRDPELADEGFSYIVSNSNVTSNSNKNYYIAQVAILWYEDYLNGNNNNISSDLKSYITSHSSDTVCYYINKLVNNAKTYGKNGAQIKFVDNEIEFTKNGSYYYSNVIDVVTNNLNSTPTVNVYNAPTSTQIINNTVTNNGEGSFQIRIPVSSLKNLTNKDFEVYVRGNGYTYSVYEYSNYGSTPVIYGRSYSSNYNTIEESMIAKVEAIATANVRVKTLDKNGNYISGISYYVYSGDCTNSTCQSTDRVDSFTSTYTYTDLSDVLSSGYYTIVRRTSTNYDLPEKTLIRVEDSNTTQTFTISEDDGYNDNYYDDDYDYDYDETQTKTFRIYNDINDKNVTIKIYTINGDLVKSYSSNNTSYSITLEEGSYYLVDSEGIIDRLYFKVINDELRVKYDNNYVSTSSIDLNQDTYNDDYIYDEDTDNEVIYDCNEDETSCNITLGDGTEISQSIESTTDVKIDWISNIIDTPITDLSSTIKYIIGATILGAGLCLVVRNVKKSKNNI